MSDGMYEAGSPEQEDLYRLRRIAFERQEVIDTLHEKITARDAKLQKLIENWKKPIPSFTVQGETMRRQCAAELEEALK